MGVDGTAGLVLGYSRLEVGSPGDSCWRRPRKSGDGCGDGFLQHTSPLVLEERKLMAHWDEVRPQLEGC